MAAVIQFLIILEKILKRMMELTYLIIPGWGDSGDAHWQSFWLKKYPNAVKLIQDNWEEPQLDQWMARLNEVLLRLKHPTILIAHSLGVALVVHWARTCNTSLVAGALLVSPSDVDAPEHTPAVLRNFAPMPTEHLPFPATVVASQDDPYVLPARAQWFAKQWGCDFVNIGNKGHINSDSKLEYWEEGQQILAKLLEQVRKRALPDEV